MKVPVRTVPMERCESLEPHLRSSLSPPQISSRLSKRQDKDKEMDAAKTAKSLEEQMEEQTVRTKALEGELESTKAAIERRQAAIEEEAKKVVSDVTIAREHSQVVQDDESKTLEKIREILKDKHPSLEKLMDISLKQEREKHEKQNEKVLQILKIKDGLIDELQKKSLELESKLRSSESAMEETQNKFQSIMQENEGVLEREKKLIQTIAEHEETIKLLNQNHEQLKDNMIKSDDHTVEYVQMKQELKEKTEECVRNNEKMESLKKELLEAEKKVGELIKRENYVIELANRQDENKKKNEEQLKKKDDLILQLEKMAREDESKITNLKSDLEKYERNMTASRTQESKIKDMELEIRQLNFEKRELENKVQGMEESYRGDNEKLATIIKQLKIPEVPPNAERSFTIEDLRSSSKDYLGRLKERIEQQQRVIEDIGQNKADLEEQLKSMQEKYSALEDEKTKLIADCNKEIENQQKILEDERNLKSDRKNVDTQTALKGDNIEDLSKIIEDLKSKMEFEEQRREEREKYIIELEKEEKQHDLEAEKAKSELEVIVKRHSEELKSSQGVSQLEQNEVLSKLNSRVSALQIQVHQLQTKLAESESALDKANKDFGTERTQLKSQPKMPEKTELTEKLAESKGHTIEEHMSERMESQEIIIVQLREEIIQLEVEKRELEKRLERETEGRDAKIKALESLLGKQNLLKPEEENSQLALLKSKSELETLKETSKSLTARSQKQDQELTTLQKEIIRLKQIDRLSKVLPSDGEIALSMTNKIKSQKTEIRHMQGLLKRAKVEYDKVCSQLQSRKNTAQENLNKDIPRTSQEQNIISSEYSQFERSQNEQKIQELENRCTKFKSQLNVNLQKLLELKEEFCHKLLEKEEQHRRQIHKLAEESRQLSRKLEVSEQKNRKLIESLAKEQAKMEEYTEEHLKESKTQSDRIKKLEDASKSLERKKEECITENKKQEISLQERSAQIAILMETIETLQKGNQEAIAQRYLNACVELSSIKATNAQLDIGRYELKESVSELKKSFEQANQANQKLTDELLNSNRQVSELKKIAELQTKQITKLEEALEESKIEISARVGEIRTLEGQLQLKEKRIEQFKNHLGDVQSRASEIKSASKRIEKTPQNISIQMDASRRWDIEEIKEAKQGDSMQIIVLLKQLYTTVEKELEKSREKEEQWSPNALLQKLYGVILKADRNIAELERSNADLMQLLAISNNKLDEKVSYERLMLRCEALGLENTTLNTSLETCFSKKEGLVVEKLTKLEHALSTSQQALNSSNYKLIELSEENSALKADIKNVEEKLEAKSREMRITQAKLEKEAVMSRVRAEEEMSLKLSIRNEEMKNYFDTHVAKLILGKEEDSKIITISKELCANKLLVDKLQTQLTNYEKEKAVYENQVQVLADALAQSNEKIDGLQYAEYEKQKLHSKEFADFAKEIEHSMSPKKNTIICWSRKALKVELDMRNATIAELEANLIKLKEENELIKMEIIGKSEPDAKDTSGIDLQDAYEVKIGNLKAAIEEKNKDIESLEKKLADMSTEHALEIQNLRSDMDLHIQEEKKNIRNEYDSLARKYRPGEAPGEIMAENMELKNQCIALKQHIENQENEAVILKQKLESLLSDNAQCKDDAELYKKAFTEMQDTIKNIQPGAQFDQTLLSGKFSSRLATPGDKKGKDTKKRPTTQASVEREIESKKATGRDESLIIKMPKFVKALFSAKLTELEAESKVRKCGRTEMELRQEIMKKAQQLKELDAKLRHYERLLKDNNIPIQLNENYEEGIPREESENWMKKRILELEAICEDMKFKDTQALCTFSAPIQEKNPEELVEKELGIETLLLEGVIALCTQLAACEGQNRDKRAHLNSSISVESASNVGISQINLEGSISVEKVQRIIIKVLTGMLKKAMGDPNWSSQCSIPSNEADRQVWYLELVELQTNNVEKAITLLKEYTSKISVDISGSLASAAQVKAAALELANQTKQTAEETANLKHLCSLVKKDIDEMAKEGEILNRSVTPSRPHSRSQAGTEISQLTDKLNLAEKIKKNLENEIVQLKMALNNSQREDLSVQQIKEMEREITKKEILRAEFEKELALEKTRTNELRMNLKENMLKLEELAKSNEKERMLRENEIREIERSTNLIKTEYEKLAKENKELQAKCNLYDKQSETLHNETMKTLEKQNKELDSKLHNEIEERRKEIEFWIKERSDMRQTIDSLKNEKETLSKQLEQKKTKTKGKKGAKEKKTETASDSENSQVIPKKTKTHEKLVKLQEEIQKKESELTKAKSELQDTVSRLQISQLNSEEEKRKADTMLADLQLKLREQSAHVERLKESADQGIRKEADEIKSNLEEMAKEKNKLMIELSEKSKKEEQIKQDKEKMVIVITELDRELKIKEKDFTTERMNLEVQLEEKNMQLKVKEKELESELTKQMEMQARMKEYDEKLNEARTQLTVEQEFKQQIEKTHRELEEISRSQEDTINKLKQDLINREEEVSKMMENLNLEFKAEKTSTEELTALYEVQFKLLKERFRNEYVELSKKLTVQTQGKGEKLDSSFKKEQNELSVDLMFQISQKDAQIKILEKETAQLKNQIAAFKAKSQKQQTKDAATASETKKKPKTKQDPSKKSAKKITSKATDISSSTTALEDQLKSYNDLMKEKVEIEMQLSKLQSIF